MENRTTIENLLRATGRAGVENLINWMTENDFFGSSCSTKYHLACDGGLAEHSVNVLYTMLKMRDALGMQGVVSDESVTICALLHDLGKCGDYDKAYYIENILKSGKRSEAEPYKTNSNLLPIPHEVRSVTIAERFIPLTEEEAHAIYYHNGKYTHIGYDLKETPMQILLHFADLWASRVVEVE